MKWSLVPGRRRGGIVMSTEDWSVILMLEMEKLDEF